MRSSASALAALMSIACLGSPRLAMALPPGLASTLAADDSEAKIAALHALASDTDPAAARVLQALAEGTLQVSSGDARLFIHVDERVHDAATGAAIDPAPEALDDVTINNRVRRELDTALAELRLFDHDRTTRLTAARALSEEAHPEAAPLLMRALASEHDAQIRKLLGLAAAQAALQSSDPAQRLSAAKALAASDHPAVKNLLSRLLDAQVEPDARVRAQARASLHTVALRIRTGELLAQLFSGLSLGSVLLLVALGLTITYGVMGVINMAHGELLMVGAYASFATQALFTRFFPNALALYPLAALPIGFAAAALAGALMERTVIRFLYGRPLETLLATWGLSLILIQAARVIFGAQNVSVANPPWMSGGFVVLGAVLPWNRIVIIAFAMGVLALTWLLLHKTRLGLFVRAVTQNRPMAACVGVPTSRLDTIAFALGAGIAGLGGVALSQIANVGPDMGQAYVVDAFMVVVTGGVGQLVGTVTAALGLGVLSKFLEGWSGAVIAKILVLVFVIAFIQKRPQGLFALKGRFAEE